MSNFKVIKSTKQYHEYVSAHKKMWKHPTPENEDDRELLDVLIEKWEKENHKQADTDPVELLKWLMESNGMDATRLSEELGVNKATTSKILNYKKGMSKYVIRKLAEMFKVSQEAFNRDYALESGYGRGMSKKKVKKKSVIRKPKTGKTAKSTSALR